MLLRWCEQVVRLQDETLREWALDASQDAGTVFRQLLMWVYSNTKNKTDRAKRRVAEATLLIGLAVLSARRSLSPLDAVRALASANPGRQDNRRNAAPASKEVSKLVMGAGFKQLFDLARIVRLTEVEIASAEDARRLALARADDLLREKAELQETRDLLSGKLQDLSRELRVQESRVTELAADLEGARSRALQDLNALKARFRRQIGEGLGGLLADAWDAIDTDPPHPGVARERLETAREAIRKEMEWLAKSSG
jgi:hypothetical protein